MHETQQTHRVAYRELIRQQNSELEFKVWIDGMISVADLLGREHDMRAASAYFGTAASSVMCACHTVILRGLCHVNGCTHCRAVRLHERARSHPSNA